MDMLDHTLDSSGDAEVANLVDSKDILTQDLTIVEEGSLGSGSEETAGGGQLNTSGHLLDAHGNADDDVQYAFRSDGGTVTYRVVHVDNQLESLPQIDSSAGFATASAVPQVLTATLNGQLYVIGNSNEVFASGNPRNIAPRSNTHVNTFSPVTANIKKRDDRRRATHNEVERRRRDKINNWIMKLSKMIPDLNGSSNGESAKHSGAFEGQSKGGILAKACEYIIELRQSNQRLGDYLKENEQLSVDIENLRQQNDLLRSENTLLRQQLQRNGVAPPPSLVQLDRSEHSS